MASRYRTILRGGLGPANAVLLVLLARFGTIILDAAPALLLQGSRIVRSFSIREALTSDG